MKIKEICTYAPKSQIKAGDACADGRYIFFTSSNDESKRYSAYQFDGEGIIMGTGGNATLHFYNGKYAVSTDCVVLLPDSRIKCKYLYYFLKKNIAVLEAGFKGAGLRHTNKEYIGNIDFGKLATHEHQKNVILTLDKAQQLIDYRTQQLSALDTLIKARFVEMFGFPGTDVYGWGYKKLGECCIINPKRSQDNRIAPDLKVSFIPMPAVSENGGLNPSDSRFYDEVKNGFTYFLENDVLFAKITPCMENGKGAIAKGLYNGIGFGSTEFHVLRPIDGVSNSYWIYVASSFDQFRKDAASNMTGSAGQRRVPSTFLDRYMISLPPITLQNEFAAFVEQVDKSKFVEILFITGGVYDQL